MLHFSLVNQIDGFEIFFMKPSTDLTFEKNNQCVLSSLVICNVISSRMIKIFKNQGFYFVKYQNFYCFVTRNMSLYLFICVYYYMQFFSSILFYLFYRLSFDNSTNIIVFLCITFYKYINLIHSIPCNIFHFEYSVDLLLIDHTIAKLM